MLVAPEDWYVAVPGVTDTGPFNQHFVRDIGLIFLLLGGAFLLGAAQPHMRVVLWTAATAWLCGHALFHFWEVAVGIRPRRPAARFPGRDPAGAYRPRVERLGLSAVTHNPRLSTCPPDPSTPEFAA